LPHSVTDIAIKWHLRTVFGQLAGPRQETSRRCGLQTEEQKMAMVDRGVLRQTFKTINVRPKPTHLKLLQLLQSVCERTPTSMALTASWLLFAYAAANCALRRDGDKKVSPQAATTTTTTTCQW